MSGTFPPLPEACARTLTAIEADPLELAPEAAAHARTCPACFEARVAWLAQAETDVQAPAGYFDRLPERVLGKLPASPRRRQLHPALWALAATLLLAVGVGAFWAGRANRAPLVEATLVQPAAEHGDARETLPDTPFQEGEEDYAQLPDLSPEQAHQLIQAVSAQAPRP